MSKELQVVERGNKVVAAPAAFDIESVFRYALDKGAGTEAMTTLMNIRRELNAEAAKKAFDEALAAFQADCPVVTKTIGVPTSTGKLAYHFAPFEHVIATVKPFLQRHGFSYTLDTDTESAQGWVIAKCHVTHSGGHSVTSTAKFPLGTKTGIMSDTQVYAAALTFASRRVFQNAFGIVCAGEDLDAQTNKPKPAGMSALATEPTVKELATELWRILGDVCKGDKNWDRANRYCWDENIISDTEVLPELSPARFKEIIAKFKVK